MPPQTSLGGLCIFRAAQTQICAVFCDFLNVTEIMHWNMPFRASSGGLPGFLQSCSLTRSFPLLQKCSHPHHSPKAQLLGGSEIPCGLAEGSAWRGFQLSRTGPDVEQPLLYPLVEPPCCPANHPAPVASGQQSAALGPKRPLWCWHCQSKLWLMPV